MKPIMAIVGVIVVLFLFGTMMVGINSAQTESRDDTFAAVTTGVGETTADVELVTDLFNDDILSVISIISNNDDDAPLPDVYVGATNTLTIRGLNASDTRNLIVTYDYGSLGDNAETVARFLNLMPILVGIALIVIIVVAGIGAYSQFRNRG